ncbi:MAG TPA: hypothetical protein VGG45_20355 [Terracidiphilus sp.]|jgi:hypothetical protein
MSNPSPEAYLRFAAQAMPNPESVAQQLNAAMTLVRAAQGALWGSQPDDRARASAALTVALGGLGLLSQLFATAAKRQSPDS